MHVYLGLGSNLGDRRAHLQQALAQLAEQGLRLARLSPIVESPALLPERSPSDWNRPFLNLVVSGELQGSPKQWRRKIKDIQKKFATPPLSRWAPRPIDIDILLWGSDIINQDGLTIPHPELHKRSFVLTPLIALDPNLMIPGLGSKTVLDWSQTLTQHIPLWMGILNITPDSFSDGGHHTRWEVIETHIADMISAGGHIIDIGAESTRPRATALTPAEEWERLSPILEKLAEKYFTSQLRPLFSIDTRHPETAEKALAWGADIINDVSALQHPAMRSLARSSDKTFIAMHHLTVPADPNTLLPENCDPCAEVESWLLRKIDSWDKEQIDLNRIIFDPGIGFGKNSLQSMELLRHIKRFRRHGLRVLVGHSRKSFMKHFTHMAPEIQDLATIGASLKLCEQGTDIIRIHDIPAHLAAYRGWMHLQT